MFRTLIATLIFALSSTAYSNDLLNQMGKVLSKDSSTTNTATNSTMDTVTAIATSETAANLTSMLVSSLGVSDKQATGGLGSLFGQTKQNLNAEQFGQIAQYVPDMDTLLKAAPAISGGKDLGGLLGNAGKIASSVQGAGKVMKQFEALGLSSDMISQFIQIAMSFLQKEGGSETTDLLKMGLGSLMQ